MASTPRISLSLLVVAAAASWAAGNVVTPASPLSSSLPQPPERSPRQLEPSTPTPVPAPATAPEVSARQDVGYWRLAGRLLLDCSRTGDLLGCLKVKAVTTLGRALMSEAPIPIMEDVALARDPGASVDLPADARSSEAEIDAELPRSLEERSRRLDRMLLERLDAFLRSRTVQLSVPLGLGVFEGRGKKDKKGGYAMIMMAAMAGMYMQMAMGGMTMMSGKALIVAKIALALAAVCLLKKSGGGGGGDHSQVVYEQEGRKKGGLGGKKGYGGYMLLALAGMKAMMMQTAMGGVAMMSGKALIIAKIALLLALLCCFKKGGNDGDQSKSQVVYAAPEQSGTTGGWQSGGGADWNRRSVADPSFAHSNAYSAHLPQHY